MAGNKTRKLLHDKASLLRVEHTCSCPAEEWLVIPAEDGQNIYWQINGEVRSCTCNPKKILSISQTPAAEALEETIEEEDHRPIEEVVGHASAFMFHQDGKEGEGTLYASARMVVGHIDKHPLIVWEVKGYKALYTLEGIVRDFNPVNVVPLI